MRITVKTLLLLTTLLLILGTVSAQSDNFGIIDTVYADLAKIDDQNWSVTINYTNDEKVVGISVPFKLDAGDTPVVADSAIYWGGRAERFQYKGFRPDTAIQCVTLGMIANMGPTKNTLMPGRGRIVTVFVSSLEDGQPVEHLTVDTTTTRPGNKLVMVADRIQGGDDADTIPLENRRIRQIKPAWVVRQSQ